MLAIAGTGGGRYAGEGATLLAEKGEMLAAIFAGKGSLKRERSKYQVARERETEGERGKEKKKEEEKDEE